MMFIVIIILYFNSCTYCVIVIILMMMHNHFIHIHFVYLRIHATIITAAKVALKLLFISFIIMRLLQMGWLFS